MEIPEFRKRLIFTLLAITIVAVILFVLPLVEPMITDNVRSFLQTYFVSRRTGEYAEARGTPFISLYFNVLKVFKIALGMIIVIVVVRLVNFLLFKRATKDGQHQAPALIRNTFSIIIYIVALFTITKSQYPGPEMDLTSIFATSSILGLILGLALQDTLGNLFSGIATQADEPFKVGDVINIAGKGTGVVESVTWRGVKIRTFQNKLLIISNAIISKDTIEVAPRNNLNARLVFFSTTYDDSPAKTIVVVRDVVRQCENVSSKIRPIVRIKNLGQDGLDWEVKFWLEDYTKYNDTDALVRQRIWYAFQREGIGIPYPTRTLHFAQKAKELPDGPQDGFFDRLAEVKIFEPLSEDETRRLAGEAVKRVFAPKESIVRMGEEGHSMFVVHRGAVNIQLGDPGQLRNVTTLHEGDIFGEMCLFTGQPRSATVTAAEETEVLEIGHFALKPLFENNPDLMEAMSKTIAERRAQLTAKQEEGALVVEEESRGIFNAIKNFFRLEQKPK